MIFALAVPAAILLTATGVFIMQALMHRIPKGDWLLLAVLAALAYAGSWGGDALFESFGGQSFFFGPSEDPKTRYAYSVLNKEVHSIPYGILYLVHKASLYVTFLAVLVFCYIISRALLCTPAFFVPLLIFFVFFIGGFNYLLSKHQYSAYQFSQSSEVYKGIIDGSITYLSRRHLRRQYDKDDIPNFVIDTERSGKHLVKLFKRYSGGLEGQALLDYAKSQDVELLYDRADKESWDNRPWLKKDAADQTQ